MKLNFIQTVIRILYYVFDETVTLSLKLEVYKFFKSPKNYILPLKISLFLTPKIFDRFIYYYFFFGGGV